MDILDYRHRLIEQLLADYRQLEQLSDPAEQLPVQQRITRLLSELKAIEQSMKRTGQQFTAYHRVMDEHDPDSASQHHRFVWHRYTRNQPLEQLFTTDQLSELIAKVGYAEANDARSRLRSRGEALLGNMDRWITQLQPLAESQTLLSWRNPFSQWLPELFLFRLEQYLKANHGRQPLVDYTMEQMSWAADYASGQPPHVNQDCLALFEHDSVVDAWVAKERERLLPEDSPGAQSWPQQRLRRLIDHRFYQPAGKALWEYVKQHALEFDQYPQRYQSLDAEAELNRQLAVNSLTANLARIGVDPRPDTPGNVNQLAHPPKAVRPQFQNENGEPYRNTQILCWRYHPEKEKELGNMALDGALFGLFTVALMYTDDNGYPTLQKPDFLQKGDHDQCLQVDPVTGNVLLLERTQAKRPQQPVEQDPMVATWYSYDEADHLAFMKQAVGLVSQRTPTQETWKTEALANLGLDADTFFNHDCGEVDLASFFELTEGYYYGFMMLPLGYGSMAIKAIHTLPFQSSQTPVAPVPGFLNTLRPCVFPAICASTPMN
ncbi:hypothetical protein [Gynuella sunshinyii]|uniref:Uncharacterized protein n=1 Tax=Gynuella sunshinyii YC6258 TaxID=1445510 RepID=A0A0C5VUX3_9GAMM|nr:hypothetical protein [Gynuella sunshinyii]AJQ97936.1 hypothetical Protein YC6258_05912 [Gynuella sunshinyii YC6258]